MYLGEGVGAAVVSDGEVRRGHGGLAGEIAHVPTVGPDGLAMPLTEVFAALGLRRPGSTAIDVPTLLRAEEHEGAWQGGRRRAIGGGRARRPGGRADRRAVGSRPARARARSQRAFGEAARHVPVEPAGIDDEPALTGAREAALQQLRDTIVAAAR